MVCGENKPTSSSQRSTYSLKLSSIRRAVAAESVGLGFIAANVNSKFLKVCKNGEWQVFVPAVAAQLKGGVDIVLDVHGGFGFHEEFALPCQAKGVIELELSSICSVSNDDLSVLVILIALKVHVPAKRFEERVQEFDAAGLRCTPER